MILFPEVRRDYDVVCSVWNADQWRNPLLAAFCAGAGQHNGWKSSHSADNCLPSASELEDDLVEDVQDTREDP